MKHCHAILYLCLIPLLVACAANQSQRATQSVDVVLPGLVPENVNLDYAQETRAEPLNVSILLFELAAENNQISRIYEPIRNAEAAYLPVLLKNTLDESGFWGAVSVVPSMDTASEVFVRGTIIASDALRLSLRIEVRDSRGVVWFDRVYSDQANSAAYEQDVTVVADPYEDLFQQIANDMSSVMAVIQEADREAILNTAMLRYAVLLSPEAFSSYLANLPDGTLNLTGLPARNDPLYRRVREIRGREYAVQDVVDAHFDQFFSEMGQVYPYWRQSSFELLAYNEQLEVKGDARRRDSWQEVERVYRLYRERKLNEDELRELANSFEREIEPTIAELEGRVIELQGSLFDQYKTWRRILREIYTETVGVAQ